MSQVVSSTTHRMAGKVVAIDRIKTRWWQAVDGVHTPVYEHRYRVYTLAGKLLAEKTYQDVRNILQTAQTLADNTEGDNE